MSEHEPEQFTPPPPDADQQTSPTEPTASAGTTRGSRFRQVRERLGGPGRRTGVAVAAGLVGGLLLGSAGAFALGAVAGGDDHGDRDGRHGRPFPDDDADRLLPPPGPDRILPSTAPEDDSGGELDG